MESLDPRGEVGDEASERTRILKQHSVSDRVPDNGEDGGLAEGLEDYPDIDEAFAWM
jgi:hypothetical protein